MYICTCKYVLYACMSNEYECTIKIKDKDMFLTPSYNSFLHPLKLSLSWLGYEYSAIHLTFDFIDGRLGFY